MAKTRRPSAGSWNVRCPVASRWLDVDWQPQVWRQPPQSPPTAAQLLTAAVAFVDPDQIHT
ncbi:hypothetical protein FQK07_04695 [Synechococcus sp. BSF8S]|uniref:hypothetical protein n=1 Tax=Synechococcales TaxID=1890424 RepID=UPI0016231E0D|nr:MULTISPECIES: hypothetical protein [unclassified Synechococcus]MBC1260573.1 hypothetical protein [Synechococcus sp. BSF8S]MBC1263224.1 hypothetical protein [Synechococcus sp. BSA11S]